MENIIKSEYTLAGSLTKLQIAEIGTIDHIDDSGSLDNIPYSSIYFYGPDDWEDIPLLPNASFVLKTEDTDAGVVRSVEISGALMSNSDAAFMQRMNKRYVLLITDGDGVVWLVGNKQEWFKYTYTNDSQDSRSKAKMNALKFVGMSTMPILQVLY
jgi:hypothetical protein